jgi:hypothetical protein
MLNLDTLDDRVLVDACTGFAGGQCSYGPPDQLPPTQAARLVNIDIRDGTAATRRGAESLGDLPSGSGASLPVQGLGWFDTPAAEYLVAAANARLWKWDGTGWTLLNGYTAVTPAAQVCLVQLINKLYIADGASNLHEWDPAGAGLTDLGHVTASGNPPQGLHFLLAAAGRLWGAGLSGSPDALWASELFAAGVTGWSSSFGSIRIGQGEGDPITGLAELDDYQVVVFKRNSIYIVRADPADTADYSSGPGLANCTVTKISDTIGCVSHRSIARLGSDVWFLSDGGVFSIARVLAEKDREVKAAVSLPVQDLIERINDRVAVSAAAIVWENRYLLALPLDDALTPNAVLVWNTQRNAWSGTWEGWAPTCWAMSKGEGHERLNFGRADGAAWRWLDYLPATNEVESTYQDAGASVPTLIETRALTFHETVCEKSPLSVQTEFFGSRAAATVAVRLDEEPPITLQAEIGTRPGELLLPFAPPAVLPGGGVKRRAFGAQHLAPFRSLQAVISSPAGKLVLRSITATAFANTMRLEQ